jgi:hypothetical protein
MYKVQSNCSTANSFVCFTLLLPSVDSSGEKDVSEEISVFCDEGHYLQMEQGTSVNPTSCTHLQFAHHPQFEEEASRKLLPTSSDESV